jgi:hypothetical protein
MEERFGSRPGEFEADGRSGPPRWRTASSQPAEKA